MKLAVRVAKCSTSHRRRIVAKAVGPKGDTLKFVHEEGKIHARHRMQTKRNGEQQRCISTALRIRACDLAVPGLQLYLCDACDPLLGLWLPPQAFQHAAYV